MTIQSIILPNVNFVRQLPTPVALLDTDFNFIGVSKPWMARFSVSEVDLLGKSIFSFFPSFIGEHATKFQYALDGLKDIQIFDKIAGERAVPKSVVWNLNPWNDKEGNRVGIVIGLKDITEIKELRMELQKTKNQLKEKGKMARIGSWEYQVDLDDLILSPVLMEIFDTDLTSPLSLSKALELFEEGNERERMAQAMMNAVDNGQPFNLILDLQSRNLATSQVNVIGRPKFKDGRCTRIIGTVQDTSNTSLISDEVAVGKVRFQTSVFFKESPTATVVTDYASGEILAINPALETLTGYTEGYLLGKSYHGFRILRTARRKSSVFRQIRKNGSFKAFEFDLELDKTTTKRLLLKGKVATTRNGRKTVISTFEDITSLAKKTSHLQHELQTSNQHISQLVNFAHLVSHQMKAHSVNFSLLLDFLNKECHEKPQKKLINVLKDGNNNMFKTIRGLRELVAIREHAKVEKSPLVLNEAIYRAEQSLSGVLRQQEAKIINEIPDTLKIHVFAPYLDSILSNVLSNAVRFRKKTKTPVLILSAWVGSEFTEVTVEDNGLGMDLSKNGEKLFRPYTSLSDRLDSRGLGLYLTKYQLDLLGGKIEVESKLGEGSTFKLFFPNT